MMTTGKKRRGRPPEPVPQDIADEICAWVADGKTLRSYCRQEGKPTARVVGKWRAKCETFRARFARAREAGFAALADECLAIADEDVPSKDAVARNRLRVDTRLKLLACWDPRRYGNKVAIGGDADAPPVMVSDAERLAKLQALYGAAASRLSGEGNELLN